MCVPCDWSELKVLSKASISPAMPFDSCKHAFFGTGEFSGSIPLSTDDEELNFR
jgi:hypothetical protein